MVLVKTGEKEYLTLAFGPPKDRFRDKEMVSLYFKTKGKKAVCGGTTSKIIARETNKEIKVLLESKANIPPKATIDGVDIVTEGILTLSRTAEIIEQIDVNPDNMSISSKAINYKLYSSLNNSELIISSESGTSFLYNPSNPAEELAQEIINAKNIRFIVGEAINAAHKQLNLPIKVGEKNSIINQLKTKLEKMGKKVEIIYF